MLHGCMHASLKCVLFIHVWMARFTLPCAHENAQACMHACMHACLHVCNVSCVHACFVGVSASASVCLSVCLYFSLSVSVCLSLAPLLYLCVWIRACMHASCYLYIYIFVDARLQCSAAVTNVNSCSLPRSLFWRARLRAVSFSSPSVAPSLHSSLPPTLSIVHALSAHMNTTLPYLPTYVPTFIHTYIHTYINAHMHIHTCNLPTYLPTYIHTYIHTYLHNQTGGLESRESSNVGQEGKPSSLVEAAEHLVDKARPRLLVGRGGMEENAYREVHFDMFFLSMYTLCACKCAYTARECRNT